MKRVEIHSPAKINLSLDIGPRENNGYHGLVSLFQLISFGDHLVLTREECDTLSLSIEGNFDCESRDNLIYKSALRYCREFGIKGKFTFQVDKRIPRGGGMGGGSSNAAAAWFALDKIYGFDFSGARGRSVAVELGSDVPFFFHRMGASLVSGYGEILDPLLPRLDYYITAAFPDFEISSSEAYRWLDQERGDSIINTPDKKGITIRYRDYSPSAWGFGNSFSSILLRRHPQYGKLRLIMDRAKAIFHTVSGSGSVYYGIFSTENQAEEAAGMVVEAGFDACKAVPIAQFPDAVVI